MDLVTGAMGSLGPKLLQLLQDEYKLQKGVRKQVQFVSRELEHNHAALRKVAAVPWDQLDEQVKLWAREVRETSYDMEDILDTFLVRVGGREPADSSRLTRALKKMGGLFRKGKARRDIAGAIEDIKMQLQEVAERRARYKVDEIVAKPAATSTIDPRLAAMYKEVTELIGIDDSRDELISMLSCQPGDDVPEKKMKRVSVVGVGGLGKTTLAKAVYDMHKGDCSCCAFVPVGRNPDLKVLKDILIDLDRQHCMSNLNVAELDERQLIDRIQEFLKEKRYFVVIDDVWEPQSWEIIKLAFVKNNSESRLITTTRNSEVAKEAGEIYKLRPLSYANSKKLLYTRIFGGEEKCPDSQPDETLDKILKKCGGVPLAIITIASLLVGKPMEEWYELYSSIGFGHNKDNMHVENTMRILSFSYYDLPSHLRTCLLYLSVYPEDYVINKHSLIWKWVGEGFVHEKQGKGLFEVGEGYFNDLINRSMIQAVEDRFGGVDGCRVHDLVLDMIRTLSNEENFVAIIDSDEGTAASQSNNARRLAHHNRTIGHISPQIDHMDMPRVRSYVGFRCDIKQWVPSLSFILLRVLAIENCQFMKGCHLGNLANLHHLRYLGVKGSNIHELPKQMGNLKFLQTLDVEGTGIKELPESVVLLTQLVCLNANKCDMRVPDGIGKLTSLQELTIDTSWDDMSTRRCIKELGSLRELRVLVACTVRMDESIQSELVESLCSLYKIQHLSLDFIFSTEEDIFNVDTGKWEAAGFVLPRCLLHFHLTGIRFSRLPSCINPSCLSKFSYLALYVATIDEQDLKLLGSLMELSYLFLGTPSTITLSNINAIDGCFRKLRAFKLPFTTVQFQRSKKDSSFPLHIPDRSDAMPSGSRNNDGSSVPSAVMPDLEELSFSLFVRVLKDGNCDCGNLGLEYLIPLKKVRSVMVLVHCDGASAAEVEEVEAALRKAAQVHPNRPALGLSRYKDGMPFSGDLELDGDILPKEEERKEQQAEEISPAASDADVAKLSLATS